MRTNMLHSNLLGRLGNGLLKFVVLVVMVCNMSGAFATTTYVGNKTYSSNSKIVISSNTDDATDTTIIKKTSPNSSDGNVTIANYANNRGTTVEIGKDENKKGVLIVEGDLTINDKTIQCAIFIILYAFAAESNWKSRRKES